MIEVTNFNVLPDSPILGVLVLVDSNGHICIVDICSIDVVDLCILDNVGGKRLVWKGRLCSVKVVASSVEFFIVFNGDRVSWCS